MTTDIINLTERRQAREALRQSLVTEGDEFCRVAVGMRLQIVRILYSVTEQEAANAVGATLKTYQRWEKGEGRMYTKHFLAFAQKYNISLDWLAVGDGTPFRYPPSASTIEQLKAYQAQIVTKRDRLVIAPDVLKEHRANPGEQDHRS